MSSETQTREEYLRSYLSDQYDALFYRIKMGFDNDEIVFGNQEAQNNIIEEYKTPSNFIESHYGTKEQYIDNNIQQFRESDLTQNDEPVDEDTVEYVNSLDRNTGEINEEILEESLKIVRKQEESNDHGSVVWIPGMNEVVVSNGNKSCTIPIEKLNEFYNKMVQSAFEQKAQLKYKVEF